LLYNILIVSNFDLLNLTNKAEMAVVEEHLIQLVGFSYPQGKEIVRFPIQIPGIISNIGLECLTYNGNNSIWYMLN